MEEKRKTNLKNCCRVWQRILFLALMAVCSTVAWAQGKVSGTVVDASGEPVIGASVMIKGSTTGTVTDLDGNFSIGKVPQNATLVFSYVGYRTQNVAVGGKSQFKITLEEDKQLLDEVVVVGYGVQRKSDVTGALTRVGEKELTAKPVNNAFEALQGKAAGVDITSGERPGEIGSITIRGSRSITASGAPLYVVDGVPLQTGGIESLNPRDIESIDILKDASSTAIYGSRGANGVVLVTTKRGQEGKMQLSYSGTMTWEKIVDKTPAMSASDYITWRRWAYYNSSPTTYTPGNEPSYEQDQKFFSGDNYALANINKGWGSDHTTWDGSLVTDTDWTDFVTQTGLTQEHSVSVRGGSKTANGFVSFGYLDNKGTQKGQKYQRYTLSAAADVQGTPWFKAGGSLNASYGEQRYGFSRTGQSSNSGPVDIYSAAKQILRYAVPYDDAGNIILMPGGSTVNTYTIIDEWDKSTDNRETFRALGSFYANIDFGKIWEPLSGLQYKVQFGPDFRYYRMGNYIDGSSAARGGGNSYARRNDQRDFAWTLDNMILYNKIFGDHSFGLTLLQSASSSNSESSSQSETAVPVASYLWNNMGAIDISNSSKYNASMGTGLTEYSLSSYMARINYSYKDRYLLTASARWDGSSVLAKGNKWSFFPSMALGWRMEQEEFMKNVTWIDQLKLRFGVGVTGNAAVSPYGTLGVISSYWMPFSTGNEMIFVTNEPFYTSGSNQMPNKKLGWEKTTQWNIGIDFSFLKGRIGGAIELYTSRTNDLLLSQSLPPLTGYPSMLANVGKTKNKGLEVTLNTIPVMYQDFTWTSNLNFAWQKDEIVELAYGKEDDINNSRFIGESISVYYGYEADGLWQESDADEMAKFNENGHKFTAGSVRPVDQNGDYKIDADDRVIIGNRNPRFTGGWTNSLSWKGLELTLELQGRFGYTISTGGEGQYGMYQQREISYWTPENTGADYQKPVYSTAGGDSYSGLLGFKDASFIKIRNLSLGYNFDKKLLSKVGIGLSNVKLYVQGKNLGMLYSSVDFMDLDTGYTYYNRGVTVGLQVDF
ncbi:MAG: TonB-dependent receptor [Prevotella sp.]|nr:TonB-dependent receptor [Prevotella sp.]